MARRVAIGIQDFETVVQNHYFYIDKTEFIREWWESGDSVTLIARPRRFGKTLNMSMIEQFFSIKYQGRGELFEGLSIWEHEKYRDLQGTYPVISLSFANVKETDFQSASYRICQLLMKQYQQYAFLQEDDFFSLSEKKYFERMSYEMTMLDAPLSLYQLSDCLFRRYGKKVIILLDEYDTPMQEAYVHGYWQELVSFLRSLFNATFKTNPWLERAVMTGITRVSKESIFSDLNHLKVVTTTARKYETAFGFTEPEVFAALEEQGLREQKEQVKAWYDGFIFGDCRDIYNPWSILNFLDTRKIGTYWANTSSNSLVSKLIREGAARIKKDFETLLQKGTVQTAMDEQFVYSQLNGSDTAIWSLLVASGYLKVLDYEGNYLSGEWLQEDREPLYVLTLTNQEVRLMFRNMVRGWFSQVESDYNDFIQAFLMDDKKAMNAYMNRVALQTFRYFDTGRRACDAEPERFYHGFVLGLLVELEGIYEITSNRESGFGRYDVVLTPKDMLKDDAIILEFKVMDEGEESSLSDTVQSALQQIEEKQYATSLMAKGILESRIRNYGFAFQGKKVLIG